jgi:threonine synthase
VLFRSLVVVVPIGNAGNVTALMEGFLDLLRLGVIDRLPTLIGVQSGHADPVYRWRRTGNYEPVKVSPSVAQAAMIGDPVSFPKVRALVEESFQKNFFAVRVSEQEIMEGMLTANRHGHVVCTQGGEAVAGLKKALEMGIVRKGERVVVDSTSHQLKFAEFQRMYFTDSFPAAYEITTKSELRNAPVSLDLSAKKVAEFLHLERKR